MPMGATVKIVADAVVGASRRAVTKAIAAKASAGVGGLAALAGLALLAGAGLGYLYVKHHRAQVEATAQAAATQLISCAMSGGCDLKPVLTEIQGLDKEVRSKIAEKLLNDGTITSPQAVKLANCVSSGNCGNPSPQAAPAPVAQAGAPPGPGGANTPGAGKSPDTPEPQGGGGGGGNNTPSTPAPPSGAGPNTPDSTATNLPSAPAAPGAGPPPASTPTNVASNPPSGGGTPGTPGGAGGGGTSPGGNGDGSGGAGPAPGVSGGGAPADCTGVMKALADAQARLQELVTLARNYPVEYMGGDSTGLAIRAAGIYQLRSIDRLQATSTKICGQQPAPTPTASTPPSDTPPTTPGQGGGGTAPGAGNGPAGGPGGTVQAPTGPDNGTQECADARDALTDAKATYETEEFFLKMAFEQKMQDAGLPSAKLDPIAQKSDLAGLLKAVLIGQNILPAQLVGYANGLSALVQKLQKTVIDRQAAVDKACKPQTASAPPGSQPPTPVTAKCGDTVKQGGDTPESIDIPVGGTSGTATLDYNTFDIPDQMSVYVDGKPAFGTGCVGDNKAPGSGGGVGKFQIPPGASNVRVVVNPNCDGTSGTAWQFTLTCPKPAQAAAMAMVAPAQMADLGPPPNAPDNNPMGGLGPPPDRKNNPPAPGGTTTSFAPPQGPIFVPIPGAPPNVCHPKPPSAPGNVCQPTPPPGNVCNPKPPSSGTNSGTNPCAKPPGGGSTGVISGGSCDTKNGVTTCTDLQGHKCTSTTGSCDPSAQTAATPPLKAGPLTLKQKPGTQVANLGDPTTQTSVPACESKPPYLPWGGHGAASITVSGGKPCGVGWHDTGATILDSMTVTSQPAHGTLRPKDQHVIVFTPAPGYKGQDSFMLQMQEHNGGRRATLTVKVDVTIR